MRQERQKESELNERRHMQQQSCEIGEMRVCYAWRVVFA